MLGSDWISASGNSSNNTIYGNDGWNWLYGDDGEDTLYGGWGDDDLEGGADTDYLYGGAGNDRYYLSDADFVVEYAGDGRPRRTRAERDAERQHASIIAAAPRSAGCPR